MPITNDKASIDFEYEWESSDGQTYLWQMKFMHTTSGPIIQISDHNGQTQLPLDMFTETVEFLSTQGVIKGKAPVPVLGRKTGSSLALPSISKAPKPEKPNVQPFASLSPEKDVEAEGDEGDDKPLVPNPMPDRPALTGKEGVTPEEAAALKAQRLAAKAKAVSDKKLTKRHRPE